MLRLVLTLSLLVSAGLAAPLQAGQASRCADVTPQARPQNTPQAFVGRTLDDITASGTIEFALYEQNPPYSAEVDGKPQGVDVDVGALIADKLGLKPSFRLVAAGENLDADLLNYVWKGAVVGGHVSDVLMRVPYNESYACRVDQVFFTGQYAAETIAIAYDRAHFDGEAPTPAYFRYDTVGVENDSISDFYLTDLVGGQAEAKIRRYRSATAAMTALQNNEVSSVMGARSQLAAALTPGLALHEPPLPGLATARWTLGIAVHTSHHDLGYAVDGIIEDALARGEIAKIYTKHGLTFTPPER